MPTDSTLAMDVLCQTGGGDGSALKRLRFQEVVAACIYQLRKEGRTACNVWVAVRTYASHETQAKRNVAGKHHIYRVGVGSGKVTLFQAVRARVQLERRGD